MSKFRKAVPAKKSRALFHKTAKKVHPKNIRPRPARGGIRA